MAHAGERELRGRITRVHSRRESPGTAQVWLLAAFRDETGESHTVEGIFSPEDLEARVLTIRGRERTGRDGRRRVVAEWVWRGNLAGWADAPPAEGIVNFLKEGGLRGLVTGYPIGPARAEALGEALGEDLWAALTTHPERLAQQVRGMMNALEIQASITDLGHARVNAIARLMVLNLSLARATRILKHLGLTAIEQIRTDPYVMSTVPGIGFATADDISRDRLDVAADDPRRLRAMARAVLVEAARNGSTSVPRGEVLGEITALGQRDGVGVDAEEVLRFARETHAVAEDLGDVYIPGILQNEKILARSAATLAAGSARRLKIDDAVAAILAELTDEQAKAVTAALTERVSIITGPPGSGKTHVIRAIERISRHIGLPVTLTASTGKAADRINSAVGEDAGIRAQTTHSVIGTYNRPKTPPKGLLVADEVTMLDLEISSRLADGAARSDGETSVVLIGDPEQLESVMAGAVFRDLCNSGVVATTHLTRVFRQEKQSLIAINGERIRRGKMPFFHDTRLSARDMEEINSYFAGEPMRLEDIRRDVWLVPAGTPEYGQQRVLDCVRRWAERGYDPVRDVMVATPRKDGLMGTKNLNGLLQDQLNPNGELLQVGTGKRAAISDRHGLPLRVGDPVMQTRNEDQEAGIINGTRGVIVGVEDERVAIDWGAPGRRTYARGDVSAMLLAYAGTVHKAQGDEVPITIFAVHESEHYINLKRSLLTVAATRATDGMVFVGTQKAIHISLGSVDERHTRLAERTRMEAESQRREREEDEAPLLPGRAGRILQGAPSAAPDPASPPRRSSGPLP